MKSTQSEAQMQHGDPAFLYVLLLLVLGYLAEKGMRIGASDGFSPGCLESILAVLGRRQGTPWTSRQLVQVAKNDFFKSILKHLSFQGCQQGFVM